MQAEFLKRMLLRINKLIWNNLDLLQQIDLPEILRNIFLYDKTAPLIFTRFFFWAFFAVVLIGYSFVYKIRTGAFGQATYFLPVCFFITSQVVSSFLYCCLVRSPTFLSGSGFTIRKTKYSENR